LIFLFFSFRGDVSCPELLVSSILANSALTLLRGVRWCWSYRETAANPDEPLDNDGEDGEDMEEKILVTSSMPIKNTKSGNKVVQVALFMSRKHNATRLEKHVWPHKVMTNQVLLDLPANHREFGQEALAGPIPYNKYLYHQKNLVFHFSYLS
jgi:hypothetical protein